MAPVHLYLIAFFLLPRLLPVLSSDGQGGSGNTDEPKCPSQSFKCLRLGELGFPFYETTNTTDSRCCLCKLNCTDELHPTIQLGTTGLTYEVLPRTPSSNRSRTNTMSVFDKVFQEVRESRSCKDIHDLNISNPSSVTFTFILYITVFKCPRNGGDRDDGDYDLYYNYDPLPVSTDYHPPSQSNCQVIPLPLPTHYGTSNPPKAEDLFSLITGEFSIQLQLTPEDCVKCHGREGLCLDSNGNFTCASRKKNHKLLIRVAVTVGSVFILACLCLVIFVSRRRYKHVKLSDVPRYLSWKKTTRDLEDGSVYFGVPVFSYAELEDATNNFDPSKELGDGGFGTVYYGKLRDGREVAVKRLYENNYKRVEHFKNEVEILTRLRHPNLVLLYGCTSRRSRELLLVYEYIPNGTVADHLHGERAKSSSLTWPIRMNIAIETASALAYLHASEIIHRDVKTNNILLDENFNVKVADFGLSRLWPNDVSHVSTAPQGTPGYVDPDYHQCYQLTDKSDVYSFGVVLIELISSMPAVDISRQRDEINLSNLAINRIQRGAFDELMDPNLGFKTDPTVERETMLVAELAFRCLQFDKEARPTMKEALEILKEAHGEERSKEGKDSVGELVTNIKPPHSPETEEVVLLKTSTFPPSPISVADKWYSSRSTTPNASGGVE